MLSAHEGQHGRGLEARGSLGSLQRNQDGAEKEGEEGAARGLRVSPAGAEAPIRAQLQGIRQLGGQWAGGGSPSHRDWASRQAALKWRSVHIPPEVSFISRLNPRQRNS